MEATESAPESQELPEPEAEDEPGEAGAAAESDPAAAAEARKGRSERRAEWMNARKRETEDLRQELQRERQARQQFEVQMAELRGQVQAQQKPQEDPHEKRIAELMEKAERHLGEGSVTKDPAAARAALAEYHKTIREINRIDAQAAVQQERQQWSQGQQDPATAAMASDLGSEFKWLRTKAGARALADEYIGELVAAGHPNGYETYRAACARVAKELGLGGAPTNGHANGNGHAQRFALPSGKNGAGGGASEPTMSLDDDQKAIADHWANRKHPNLSEDAGRKMWWNAIGKHAAKAAG